MMVHATTQPLIGDDLALKLGILYGCYLMFPVPLPHHEMHMLPIHIMMHYENGGLWLLTLQD